MFNDANIIYEDQDLMVIDKPPGILTVPTAKKEKYTITNCIKEILVKRGSQANIFPCHRLDRETSGLIIYAKTKSIQEIMFSEFKNGQVRKRYIAFVSGTIKRPSGTISFSIENKKAITKYKLLQKRKGYSIIDVAPTTGRTNQIRIHFKMIGHPLLGDRKFSFGRDFKVKFKRVALHANEIKFRHPKSREDVCFFSPLPEDMSRFSGMSQNIKSYHLF